jgi:hypothetical protein
MLHAGKIRWTGPVGDMDASGDLCRSAHPQPRHGSDCGRTLKPVFHPTLIVLARIFAFHAAENESAIPIC